jgi:hypothetical protein
MALSIISSVASPMAQSNFGAVPPPPPVRPTDFVIELAKSARVHMLMRISSAIQSQANHQAQSVLGLLQG